MNPSGIERFRKRATEFTPDVEEEESVSLSEKPSGTVDVRERFEERAKELPPKAEPESTIGMLGRGAVRGGVRVAETLGGLPGNLVSFAKQFSAPKEVLDNQPAFTKYVRGLAEKLPTSSDLKDMSSRLTDGYTDPKGRREEAFDDLVSLTTALAVPGSGASKMKSLLTSAGLAASAISAKEGVKSLGGGPKTQAAAELGTLLFLTIAGKSAPQAYVSSKYRRADLALPAEDVINTNRLTRNLSAVEKDLSTGVSTKTKDAVLKPLGELKKKAQEGTMTVREIKESYTNINEILRDRNLFSELTKPDQKLLRHRFDKVRDVIRDEVIDYGKRENPVFLKEWQGANEAQSVLHRSDAAMRFLSSPKMKYAQMGAAGTLLGHGMKGLPGAVLGAAQTVAAGVPAYLTMRGIYRFAKSPTLRKNYIEVINAAADHNVAATTTLLEKLNKELGKDKKIKAYFDSSKSNRPSQSPPGTQ